MTVAIRCATDENITGIIILREFMGYDYIYPTIWHVVGSLAHVIFFAGIFYFGSEHRWKPTGKPEKHNGFATWILYGGSAGC